MTCPGCVAHMGMLRCLYACVVITPYLDGIAVVIVVVWVSHLSHVCFVVIAAYDPERMDVGPRDVGPHRTRR